MELLDVFGVQLAAEQRHVGGLVGWGKNVTADSGGDGDEVTGEVCAGDTSEWSFPRCIDSAFIVIILALVSSKY